MSSSTNDVYAILQTAVVLGVITLIFYAFLRPARPSATAAARQQQQTQQQGTRRQEKTGASIKTICTRSPPHLSVMSARITQAGGLNVLSDGMVAFRHNKVAAHESSLESTVQAKNRKERAKVLSNLLSGSDGAVSTPPVKGGAVVVAVPLADIACEKLRRVVYLLATYYSLLLIVTVDSSFKPKDMKSSLNRLRGNAEESSSYLAPDILPDHRVTASSSVTGRVAFVRQLQRIELVLDFDVEVKESLSRFGHRVIVYGVNYDKVTSESQSKLGNTLL